MTTEPVRKVRLRQEHNGDDWRSLWASVDESGNLRIEGQDLGPATAIVSPTGEHEWDRTIEARYLPRLIELLGVGEGEDLLDALASHWSGDRSYALEALLRENKDEIPAKLWVWP